MLNRLTTIAFAAAFLVAFAAPCDAQFMIGGGGRVRAVMSSQEFDRLVAELALDDAQREIAASLFDDAQPKMFAAKAEADRAIRASGILDRSPEAEAKRADARRSERAALGRQLDDFCASLAAIVRPDQRETLERERLALKRSMTIGTAPDRMLSSTLTGDVEDAVRAADVGPEARTAAYRALAPYRQALAAALTKAVDGQLDEGTSAAANAHRQALQALEPAITDDAFRLVAAEALRRIWPMAGSDPSSPARVFRQLLADPALTDSHAAITDARNAWWKAWWPSSLRLTSFFDRGARLRDPDAAAVRAEREAADRQAWKTLADLVPSKREFFMERAELTGKQATPFMPMPMASEPSLPSADGTTPAPAQGAPVAVTATFTIGAAVTVDASGPEGDGALPETVFIGGTEFESGGSTMMVLGSEDGADGTFSMDMDFDPQALAERESIGNARLPDAMTADEAARAIRALGGQADAPALATLVDDYRTAMASRRSEVQAALKEKLVGQMVKWGNEIGIAFDGAGGAGQAEALAQLANAPEVGIDAIRDALGMIDTWESELAARDDEFLGSIAAVTGAGETDVQYAQQRRAAVRLAQLAYPSAFAMDMMVDPVSRLDPMDAIGTAELSDAQASTVRDVLRAWSQQSLAQARSRRAVLRECTLERIQLERDQVKRLQGADAADPTATSGDEPDFERIMAIEQRIGDAERGARAQAIAGRDAAEAALDSDARARFRSAWLELAQPRAYRDREDATPAIDRARSLDTLTAGQRSSLDALRNAHASEWRGVSDRLAELMLEQDRRGGMVVEASERKALEDLVISGQLIGDTRFERTELDGRTMRRLRSVLTPEQAREVPALNRKVSPAPTRPGLIQLSP